MSKITERTQILTCKVTVISNSNQCDYGPVTEEGLRAFAARIKEAAGLDDVVVESHKEFERELEHDGNIEEMKYLLNVLAKEPHSVKVAARIKELSELICQKQADDMQ